ncbi:MAG: 2-oxoglutarate dehydrogenase, E2 component, dihydrolipoamide succinyltransferase, partial [Ignavibacteriae bacterium]|nr:2-oxoglutarate dehydrogenase, E2 component, dihydrolipoamide succinyltransferase [Ignavibacteriota bacterium]
MTVDVVMPKMGESIQEGKILKWLKKPGDKIERDEILLEISTDKVDTEVPAPNAGIIVALLAQENDTVEVGNVIARIETDVNASVAAPAPVVTAPVAAPAPPVEASVPVVPTPVPAAPAAVPTPAVPAAAATPAAPAPAQVATSGATIDVVMPKMGESIQEGKILKWLKKPGDKIERDEILLEISTDKVDTEVPSPNAGIVSELLAAENDVVEVGNVIARISTGATATVNASSPSPAAPVTTAVPAPAPQAPVTEPQVPIPSPASTNGSASAPANVPAMMNGGTADIPRASGKRFYSPLVRTIAESEKVMLEELETISGTGLEGRVTKNDLQNYIDLRKTGKVAPAAIPAPAPATAPTPATAAPAVAAAPKPAVAAPTMNIGPDDEVIPMDRMRQLISDHMVRSKTTSPHVTSVAEADVTGIVKFREKTKAAFEKREGFKLTFTPFFAKAALDGIKQFPMVNVSVDGKNIIRHKRLNLSFATALDDGNLIVPVIKNADALNITGLGRAVADLSTRARTKKLAPDDVQGGTFTITNVGSFGSLFGTPVINQPQTAIMGIGAIQKRPVVREVNGEDMIVI